MTEIIIDAGLLGRLPALDHRDKRHLARFATPEIAVIKERRWMHWITGSVMDQGNTSQCVAYSWEQYLASSPIKNKFYKDPASLYAEAQLVDEWDGSETTAPFYEGTSVRAGAKVLQSNGYIGEYAWAFGIDAALAWLLAKGPVVLGIDWETAMFEPFMFGKGSTRQSFIRLGGAVEGGHAIMAKGINLDLACWCGRPGAVRLINSWGQSWGDGGKVWICRYELDRLIQRWGECCMASELKFRPQV